MTARVARLLFPFSIAVAGAVWAKGYAEVGDGFSAGAIAGLGAVIQYACLDHEHAARVVGARWAWQLVVFGLLGVLMLLIGPTLVGIDPVTHFPGPGKNVVHFGVIEVHSALLFDLAVVVTVYGTFVGTFDRLFPPLKEDEP